MYLATLMLLGSGELGREFAIAAKRLGCRVIACDRYANAPAMQVADAFEVFPMLDGKALKAAVEKHKPDVIVPEIEAIDTAALADLEGAGWRVAPSAKAVQLTMNRDGIRDFAANQLGLVTSQYRFAESRDDAIAAAREVGLPCVVKPVMSSSGKGQSTLRKPEDIDAAWEYAQSGGRAGQGRAIVEGFVAFDYEITLLTVRHRDGTSFCEPIGHLQVDGDYRESWQPQPMSDAALERARHIAKTVTDNLGGHGIFGVELFVKGDDVWFSEVSPRPHDTGLVTLVSQDLPQFALHARAILGLPIPRIEQRGPSASCAVLAHGHGVPLFGNVDAALAESDTALRLFGKPRVAGHRRVAVTLARADSIDNARAKARASAAALTVQLAEE